MDFFGIGSIKSASAVVMTKEIARGLPVKSEYRVTSAKTAAQHIVPFFDAHPLFTTKVLDYLDWKKGINMVNEPIKLRPANHFELLASLVAGLNTGRTF
jgi:hypothetical protein